MKRWHGWFTTHLIYVAFTFVLVLMLTSCGGGDGDDAQSLNQSLSGNYTGTMQDSGAGAGRVQSTLLQSGSSLSGTFQITFANPQNNNSGTISGTVDGSSATLTFTPSVPTSCPFNATITQVSDTQLSGTFATLNCIVAVSGTFNITRQ